MNVLTKLMTFVAVIVLLFPTVAKAADQSVWPLTPYRVRVLVAFAPEASLTPRLQTNLLADLSARIEAVVGTPWNVTVAAAPPELGRAMIRSTADLQVDQIPFGTSEPDKILLLAVAAAPGSFTVTARDFDVHTRTLSTAVVCPVWQIGELCDTSLGAMFAAFAPLARIDRVEGKGKDVTAVLRVKANGLPTRDRNLALLSQGDVFRPIVRYNSRDSKFLRSAQTHWSLCIVDKIVPEEVRANVHTGMRSEMLTKGRGRAEALALRVKSTGGPTLVTIQSRVEPKKPLAGCDVYAYPPDKKDAVVLVGQTDRQGRLLVPSLKNSLTRVLLVKNGSVLLAKLPIVPGLETQLTAEMPSDDQRLGAEGFITGMQDELFDLIARQKILTTLIHSKIEAKDFEKVAAYIAELRRLPTAQQFVMRVAREQERLATNDPSVQKKINMLFGDTRKMIDKYLAPRIIEEMERELRDAKKSEETTAEAKEQSKPT